MIFLLPPSESKQLGGNYVNEKLSFNFSKPLDIASHATPKDLKCNGTRYEEGILFNKKIQHGPFLPAIERYTGVMFKALKYDLFDRHAKNAFDDTVLILSGMYGLLRPSDRIANYKLPIGTKGLLAYRGNSITDTLNSLPQTQLIDLLPASYKKMICRGDLSHHVVHVDLFQDGKRLTHAVKGVKGRWLHKQIQQGVHTLEKGVFGYSDENLDVEVVIT